MRVLAGDIGGTKTRLALFQVDGMKLVAEQEETFSSGGYASLDEILRQFAGAGELGCRHACFGIAGPVIAGKAHATNLPWVVDAARLAQELGLDRVTLINDLEANAWGIAALCERDFMVLNVGDPWAAGNAVVIAAGTGLGEAGMYWDGKRHRPFAAEGGHTDFSPKDDLEIALLRFLSRDHVHVSWERVISGPGLARVHAFLRQHEGIDAPSWLEREMRESDPSAAVSRAALEHRDGVCVEALSLFVRLYGAEAGNLALKHMASGGVYVGGGVAPKIIDRLREPDFLEAFWRKGRMEEVLRAMPVKVILNDGTALYGAALCAAAANTG